MAVRSVTATGCESPHESPAACCRSTAVESRSALTYLHQVLCTQFSRLDDQLLVGICPFTVLASHSNLVHYSLKNIHMLPSRYTEPRRLCHLHKVKETCQAFPHTQVGDIHYTYVYESVRPHWMKIELCITESCTQSVKLSRPAMCIDSL